MCSCTKYEAQHKCSDHFIWFLLLLTAHLSALTATAYFGFNNEQIPA